MAKLHEILAVEKGLQTVAKQTNQETIKTFNAKDAHFVGTVREIRHFDETDSKLNTDEFKDMVDTVFGKLVYNAGPNIKAWDAYFQKEATNQKAAADIVIDDGGAPVVLGAGVPATVLLGLETKLAELKAVYDAIPTLAPGPTWVVDTNRRATGVYRSEHADVTFRTRKTVKPIIMAPATQQHPAQVQAIQEDLPVATITTQHWSGMITTAQKSELLGRIDRLLRAVKQARQRANATEAVKGAIGKVLFNFIHDGIVA